MLTLLLSAALMGPPEPHPCPSGETWSLRAAEWACRPDAEAYPGHELVYFRDTHVVRRRLSRTQVLMPLGLALAPAIATHLVAETVPGGREAWPPMKWAVEDPWKMYAVHVAIGAAASYLAHRTQRKWIVNVSCGLFAADLAWDVGVLIRF